MVKCRQIIDNQLVEVDPDDVNDAEDVWVESPDRGTNFHNKEIVLKSDVCGCHDCGRTFRPSEINEWWDDDDTAECPYCGSDYVAGSADYASKEAFAIAMAEPEPHCNTRIVKSLDYTKNDPCYYIERYREGAREDVWLSKAGEVGPAIDDFEKIEFKPVGQHFPSIDEAVAYAKRELGINEEDWITIGDGLKVEDWIYE